MAIFGLCLGDPIIETLRGVFGQNILKVPEERYRPLTVMAARNSRISFRGSLPPLIMGESLELPDALFADSRMTNIAGKRSRSVNLNVGLQILEGFLGGLGVPSAGVTNAFTGATQVSFRFDDVVRKWVDINSVGALLRGRRIDAENPAAAIFFGAEQFSFLVLDSVITSTDFTISVDRASAADFRLNVPAIQQLVANVSATIRVTTTTGLDLSFKGQQQLAFSFSCVRFVLSKDGTIDALVPAEQIRGLLSGFAAMPEEHEVRYSPDRILLTSEPAMIEVD